MNLIFFICLGSIGCDKPCPEDMSLITGLKSAHNRLNAFVNLRSLTKEAVSGYYQATYLKEIILNGQTFLDVYEQGFDTNMIYYNLEKGIIGFVDANGELWIVI